MDEPSSDMSDGRVDLPPHIVSDGKVNDQVTWVPVEGWIGYQMKSELSATIVLHLIYCSHSIIEATSIIQIYPHHYNKLKYSIYS